MEGVLVTDQHFIPAARRISHVVTSSVRICYRRSPGAVPAAHADKTKSTIIFQFVMQTNCLVSGEQKKSNDSAFK